MSPVDDIQSRSAIILSDLACVEGNQESIAEENGIAPLVNLLDSELEDVLVNAVNAIRVLCDNNYRNKTSVAECHGLESLVEFLTVDSRKFLFKFQSRETDIKDKNHMWVFIRIALARQF